MHGATPLHCCYKINFTGRLGVERAIIYVRKCMYVHACMYALACMYAFFVFLQDSEQVVERVRLACHFPIGDHNDLSTLNSLALGFKQMYRKVITPQSFDNPRLSITSFTTKGFPNS